MFTNPAQALSGAVAGLSVSQTSGNPGSAPTLVLRGGTNFDGSGSPLILIDGQVRSSLSDINPDDIESMEVLKDAGATAIYGARANDGVVLVTTKRGKSGRAEVNLKAKFGLNYFKDSYNFMNAGDYLYWHSRNRSFSGKRPTVPVSASTAIHERLARTPRTLMRRASTTNLYRVIIHRPLL